MIVLWIVLVPVATGSLVWAVFIRPQHEQPYGLELRRIDQLKHAAMDDIHRRRQYAEDQLRRLSRWT